MTSQVVGLLIGGVASAFLFGFAGFFQKSSQQAGIGLSPYLLGIGLGVCIVGTILHLLIPDRTLTFQSAAYACSIGLFWASGMSLVAIALTKYSVPLAKLAPVYNLNTLVTVFLGLVIFAEWKDIQVVKLLVGALLTIVGATLVAGA